MAAPRLSDAQKQDLIRRFQAGENTQELAGIFGCSANTVTRVVKTALDPADYEKLKRQRHRRAAPMSSADPAAASAAPSADPCPSPLQAPDPELTGAGSARSEASPEATSPSPLIPAAPEASSAAIHAAPAVRSAPEQRHGHEGAPELAIDDAEDFSDEDDDEELSDVSEDGDEDEAAAGADGAVRATDDSQAFVEVPIDPMALNDQPLVTARPFQGADLPASVYMLVDKTVELQALSLSDVPDLGRLAPEEMELQALVLYTNPRQAKRLCGRSQRVIKLPDTRVLQRTAPYLVRQGIRRVVIEGALYSLHES